VGSTDPGGAPGDEPGLEESEQLGHGYVGDEHLLLGLLGEESSQASSLLRAHGLDLPGARAELRLVTAGLTPRSHTDVRALRAVGIDVENARQRLVAAFGAAAAGAARRCAGDRFSPSAPCSSRSPPSTGAAASPCRCAPKADVERFFTGLELVESGVEVLPRWRPDATRNWDAPTDGQFSMCGGVARKP
jgi:hypothetical protein